MKKNSTIFSTRIALLLLTGATFITLRAQTAIGGLSPDPSAMLDVQSTSSGVLLPRMTTAQRDGINNGAPATGLMIFNTTTQCLEINLGSGSPSWQSVKCVPPPISALDCASTTFNNFPLLPTGAATTQSFTIPYTGGAGSAHSGQVVTASPTGVTGLTATLDPGTFANGDGSLTYEIAGTPSAYGTAIFNINIGGQTCVLNVPVTCGAYVAAGAWKEFLCHNLGADTNADPFTPSWKLNGDYYKWGNSSVAAAGPTSNLVPNDEPLANWNTILAGGDDAWTDSNPMSNNPCPAGYRVPTMDQWNAVKDETTLNPQTVVGTWTEGALNYDSGIKFGSGLFLPAPGFRSSFNGGLQWRNYYGYYWSSTLKFSSAGSCLRISSLSTIDDFLDFNFGLSVRCIAE